MIRYVAFLDGINVAGHDVVSMDDLRSYFEQLGFTAVSTYTQSGNVLFETEATDESLLQHLIAHQLKEKLGYEVVVIVRMFHELRNVIKNNPYEALKMSDNRSLYITFLSETPPYAMRGALGVYSNDAEDARLVKKEVYILTANYGQTCFPNSLIEKKLGVSATTRNWMTVNKLVEL